MIWFKRNYNGPTNYMKYAFKMVCNLLKKFNEDMRIGWIDLVKLGGDQEIVYDFMLYLNLNEYKK